MTKAKNDDLTRQALYKVGDHVSVNHLPCQIIEVDQLEMSGIILYMVSYDNAPIANTLVTEDEIDA